MMFWLIALALSLGVAGLLARPLLRTRGETLLRSEYDMAVYKDQLGEIDQDVERGVLTADQAEAARLEVRRRVLSAASRGEKEGVAKATAKVLPRWARTAGTAGILLIPLASVALYLGVGAPGMPDFPMAQRLADMRAQDQQAQEQAKQRIADLRQQVAANPKDVEAQLTLARLLLRSGAAAESRAMMDALAKANPMDALVQAEYGQFLVSAAQGSINADAHATFMAVLALDRMDPRARFFLGLERLQLGDPEGALSIWRDLEAQTPPDAPWLDMLKGQIREVAVEAGIAPISITNRHPLDFPKDSWSRETAQVADQDPGAAMRAEADANRAPGQGFSDEEKAMIDGMVANLQERLASEPEDFDGWMMLGRSLANLGRAAEAVEAYAKASALRPDDLDPKRLQARALMAQAQADHQVDPPAAIFPLMDSILAADPEDREALFFMGLKAANGGDAVVARDLWGKLLTVLPDDGPLKAQIQQRLDALPK
jgi:cytochrome c-type biogenesis protein CcmH